MNFLTSLAAGIVSSVLGVLLSGFLLMVMLGVWHSQREAVPLFGFAESVTAMTVIYIVSSHVRASSAKE